jgi:hypothetical protein
MIISLGSNCSVTYQLNKYNLRKQSFPFDWAKITIKQLNKVLENKFKDYDNVFIKKFSENHDSSYIVSNKYNITFAHEIFNKYSIKEFNQVLVNRINNFITRKGVYICDRPDADKITHRPDAITFVRIELQPITESYIAELNKLIILLDIYFDNYKIILLIDSECNINCEISPKIIIKKVVNFDNFIDWKMDYIDWYNIFYNISIPHMLS